MNTHYIDNQMFLSEIKKYKQLCNEHKEKNKELPPLPDYIGECFMKISEHLSFRPNFVNYAFRDEMVADGIENCVQYAHNFDPEKSNNPFAYFTQIIYYAFVRRIQKEKKHLYIKYKSIQDKNLLSDNTTLMEHETHNFNSEILTEEQKTVMYEYVQNFEKSKKYKKNKTIKNSLDHLFLDQK